MDFNQILEHIGNFGGLQLRIYTLACIIYVIGGFHLLASVFLMAEPKHRCYISNCDNLTTQYYEKFVNFAILHITDNHGEHVPAPCAMYERIQSQDSCGEHAFNRSKIVSCVSYKWDRNEFESTIVSEFDIVCQKSWNVAFSNSFFMTGLLFGSTVFGMISDRYGRKTVINLASVLLLFSSFATAFAPSFVMFSFFRFLTSASAIALIQAIYILVIEFLNPSERLLISNLTQISSPIGQVTLGILACYIREWRTLELVISIAGLTLVPYFWISPESIRWLISKEKYEKAIQTTLTVAKWNNVVIPKNLLIVNNHNEESVDSICQKKVGYLDLLRTPRLRKWSINVFFSWTVNTLVYYGLALSTEHLYGNIYLNFSLLSLVEIIGILFATWAISQYGSRCSLSSFLVLCGLSCAVSPFAPADIPWASVILAIIGRCTITASFTVIYFYSTEIFPTVLRSTGIGLSNAFGRIGGIIAPLIIQLSEYYSFLPMLVFSIASVTCGILTLALPETHKRQLPDTVEEAENFGLSYRLQNFIHTENGSSLFKSVDQGNCFVEENKPLMEE